jgi:hypothetical protein
MANDFTREDEALLAELGVEAQKTETATYTPREERIIAGFEEIQRFVEEHGRPPQHGEDRDIFERMYAVRLDRIRASEECMTLLGPLDEGGLLAAGSADTPGADEAEVSDEALLDALGVDRDAGDLTKLKHVRPRVEINRSEEVAQRTPCRDFDQFRPIFEQVQRDLDAGARRTAKYKENAEIETGELFIVEGQKALVATMKKEFLTEYERMNRRMRVIYDNGTEANLLLRSFQRALYRDKSSRRILPSDADAPALFSDQADADDAESGFIYVLRSLSDHPFIAEHRDVIHKIGVTGGDVERRIGNAKKDPTFLLAAVELVASYKLANINRVKLERLLHEFFAEARMDVRLRDRFGGAVEPREWFLVPLRAIEEFVQLLIDGRLADSAYDTESAQIVEAGARGSH